MAMVAILLMVFLFLTAVFLILLVLIQRGKGGGLAGAFGGMGGQSAFGTKAGDTFTKITVGVATFWILLCIISVAVLGTGGDVIDVDAPLTSQDSGAPLLPESGASPEAAPSAPAAPAGENESSKQ